LSVAEAGATGFNPAAQGPAEKTAVISPEEDSLKVRALAFVKTGTATERKTTSAMYTNLAFIASPYP